MINESMMCERFYQKNNKNNTATDVISKTKEYIFKHISNVKTAYLRERMLMNNKCYVPPIEKAMGLKWKTKVDKASDLLNHQLIQTTFQFVPPSKTIAALFANPEFNAVFNEYNEKKNHICTDGVYEDYCCGNLCKNSEILRSSDTAILNFGIDEVELCCGMKTKAGEHKIFAVYFQIRNMPVKIFF